MPSRRTAALMPVGLLGVAAPLVLRTQALTARREITGLAAGQVWPAAARGLVAGPGTPVRLVILGDSSGVGIGAARPEETAGQVLLARLADEGFGVQLDVLAVSGAVAADLAGQVRDALTLEPDVVAISIGANDVARRSSVRRSARCLHDAVASLRAGGTAVVVATAPDLGAVKRIGRPLRWLATLSSRRLWRAQVRAVTRAGGIAVPVGALLGPAFARDQSLFSADGFHPSSAGYAALADALWPDLLAAVRQQVGRAGGHPVG